MGALVRREAHLPVLDTPDRWRQDLRVLCAVAGGTACAWVLPMAPGVGAAVMLAGVLSGALIGTALGGSMRGTLDRMRRRLPLWGVALLAPVLGAALAVAVGELGLLFALPVLGLPASLWAFAEVALYILAPIGAVLGGLLWLPYAMTVVLRQTRWPVLAATAVLTPLVTAAWVWLFVLAM